MLLLFGLLHLGLLLLIDIRRSQLSFALFLYRNLVLLVAVVIDHLAMELPQMLETETVIASLCLDLVLSWFSFDHLALFVTAVNAVVLLRQRSMCGALLLRWFHMVDGCCALAIVVLL